MEGRTRCVHTPGVQLGPDVCLFKSDVLQRLCCSALEPESWTVFSFQSYSAVFIFFLSADLFNKSRRVVLRFRPAAAFQQFPLWMNKVCVSLSLLLLWGGKSENKPDNNSTSWSLLLLLTESQHGCRPALDLVLDQVSWSQVSCRSPGFTRSNFSRRLKVRQDFRSALKLSETFLFPLIVDVFPDWTWSEQRSRGVDVTSSASLNVSAPAPANSCSSRNEMLHFSLQSFW